MSSFPESESSEDWCGSLFYRIGDSTKYSITTGHEAKDRQYSVYQDRKRAGSSSVDLHPNVKKWT